MQTELAKVDESQDVETLYAYGYQCLNAGQFKRSANVFMLLLHRDPDRVRILVGLGVSLRKLGQYQNACVAFQEAVKLDPQDPRGPYQLGITLILLGNGKAGRRLLGASLALCDRDTARWSSLRQVISGITK
jgi:Flp pilus assembly protein TadD